MKVKSSVTALLGASLLCGATLTAFAYDGAKYAKEANITMPQARAQALQIAPGKIKDAELEKEGGGSGLRYSFDIQTRHGLREVGIDAKSGKVLENSAESHRAEAQEARSEHEHQDQYGKSAPEQEDGHHD